MTRLHIRSNGMRPAFGKSLFRYSAAIMASCALPHISNAQTAKPEVIEPLTQEDIADGVAAVNALKQDKAKVETYCGMIDMLDEAEGSDGKAADPKAEEAMDAKVEKIVMSLGEDFSDAYFALQELPEDSAMGKPLAAAFEELDKACESEGK
jgi:hypothetical protein